MKLFAIVDKDGKEMAIALGTPLCAWSQFAWNIYRAVWSDIDVAIFSMEEQGYRCIELHTYDPSKQGVYDKEKQVVVDGDSYDYVCGYVKCLSDERARKFLKAGEMKS